MLTKRAAVDGDNESFTLKRRWRAQSEQVSRRWGQSLREATPRQNGPFLPINGAASLTRRSERISKWEIFGSANVGEFEASLRRGTFFDSFAILGGC